MNDDLIVIGGDARAGEAMPFGAMADALRGQREVLVALLVA